MSKSLKVLVVFDADRNYGVDSDLSECLGQESWKSEAHVLKTIKGLGHEVRTIGIHDNLKLLLEEAETFKPDVVFNLMEVFNNDPKMASNVVALIEILKLSFTGCSSLGLSLCKDKSLAKKVLTFHGIKNPKFDVLLRGKPVKRDSSLSFPILIKPLVEDASYGISMASFVENDAGFEERVKFLHESSGYDAIAEEYVDGRELYVSVLGSKRLQVGVPREMKFGQMPENGPRIATYKAKWDENYRERWEISNVFIENPDDSTLKRIETVCKEAYRALRLNGYARLDLRPTEAGEVFVIEVNPSPYIAADDDFALSAERAGLPYERLIQTILDQAFS